MTHTLLTLTIDFVDKTTEQHNITKEGYSPAVEVSEGVLNVYSKDGEYAPRVHVGSWPLIHIRKYKVTSR